MNSTIVMGLGPSLGKLTSPNDFHTIGVNDIDRYHTPNQLVLLDDPPTFISDKRYGRKDRFEIISNTNAGIVWSCWEWPSLSWHGDVRKLELMKYSTADSFDIDGHYIPNWMISPFPAVAIAYQQGFKRIGLLGVDLCREHHTRQYLESLNIQFNKLRLQLEERGVELVNLSERSALTLPKASLDSMK